MVGRGTDVCHSWKRSPSHHSGNSEMIKTYRGLKDKVKIMQMMEGINNPELEPKVTRTLKKLQKDLAPEMEAIKQAPMTDMLSRLLEEAKKL